jgi:hypothetical protein
MSLLNFFGDVHLERPARSNVPLEGDYVCNLESPVTRSARPEWGKINLKAGGIFFMETFGRDPVAVCLANNHIMDYGEEGLRDTLEVLGNEGIRSFGAGSLADHCHNPLLLDLDGQRIALLGYVCPTTHAIFAAGENHGVAPIDLEVIAGDISTAKENGAECIIVQLHWGEEDVGLPRPADVARAHGIIDRGADLIIGHHAHCIQPFEVFKGKHIFYGLGNALFPDTEMVSYTQEGLRTGNRQMAWKKWNRRSLTVRYDTRTGAAKIRLLLFANTLEVVPGAPVEKLFGFNGGEAASYRRKYAWVAKGAMLRRVVASFVARPRIPKKKNWRWVVGLFRTGKTP